MYAIEGDIACLLIPGQVCVGGWVVQQLRAPTWLPRVASLGEMHAEGDRERGIER
jgi:hypothetical protein